jgi:hypothetical protein
MCRSNGCDATSVQVARKWSRASEGGYYNDSLPVFLPCTGIVVAVSRACRDVMLTCSGDVLYYLWKAKCPGAVLSSPGRGARCFNTQTQGDCIRCPVRCQASGGAFRSQYAEASRKSASRRRAKTGTSSLPIGFTGRSGETGIRSGLKSLRAVEALAGSNPASGTKRCCRSLIERSRGVLGGSVVGSPASPHVHLHGATMRRLMTWFGGLGRRQKVYTLAIMCAAIATLPCYALGIMTVVLKDQPIDPTPTRQAYVPAATRLVQTVTATARPVATATVTPSPIAAPPTQTLEPTPTQFVPPTSAPTAILPNPSAAPTQRPGTTPLPSATVTRPAPTATPARPALTPTATNHP